VTNGQSQNVVTLLFVWRVRGSIWRIPYLFPPKESADADRNTAASASETGAREVIYGANFRD
jgi:hypothetical protein